MKKVILVSLVLIAIVALFIINNQLNALPYHDFVEYWASGRLNFTGGNPYDAQQMLKMEQTAGCNDLDALMMWNPPWVLPFSMFFGVFPFPISRFLWFLIQITIILFCAIILWKIYGGKKSYEWIALIGILSFGPILHTLKFGQLSVLLLLGSVGFLYFLRFGSDFWAGVLASMVLIKPHLLYLFVLAVIIWSLSHRRYRILIGIATALIVSTVISLSINPHLISEYLNAIGSYPPDNWMTATLGTALRMLFGVDQFYLQFLPSVVGVCWLIAYWILHRKVWNWITMLPIIILVSAATASYGWVFDSAVCVWAVIQIAVLFDFNHWTIQNILIITTFWIVNIMNIFLTVTQSWFLWLASFYLIWYLLSLKHLSSSQKTVQQDSNLITI